jgi:hypothetical protein
VRVVVGKPSACQGGPTEDLRYCFRYSPQGSVVEGRRGGKMKEDIKNSALRNSIRGILLNEWDPIGVRNYGGPDDEYDHYIDRILDIIKKKNILKQIYLNF